MNSSQPSSTDEQLPLQGALAELPVPYLLASLRRQQRTGMLLLTSSHAGDRSLFLMDGDLIAAKADKADLRLSRRLLRAGLVSRSQIERAFELLEPHQALADVLVAQGRLTLEQREELQTEFFRELVLSSFLIVEGEFVFTPLEAIFESNLQLFHDTDELLLEGRLLLERSGPVVSLLQQDNPIFSSVGSATFEALTPDEEAILSLADGKRPSSHVMALSPLSWLATIQALTVLLDKKRLTAIGHTAWLRPELAAGFPFVSEDAEPTPVAATGEAPSSRDAAPASAALEPVERASAVDALASDAVPAVGLLETSSPVAEQALPNPDGAQARVPEVDPESLRRTVLLTRVTPDPESVPQSSSDAVPSGDEQASVEPVEAAQVDGLAAAAAAEGGPEDASAPGSAESADPHTPGAAQSADLLAAGDTAAASAGPSDQAPGVTTSPEAAAVHPDEPEVQELWVDQKVFQPRDHSNPQAGVFLSGDSVLDTIDLSHIQSFHIASDIPLDGIVEAGSAEDEGHEYEHLTGDDEHDYEDEDDDDAQDEAVDDEDASDAHEAALDAAGALAAETDPSRSQLDPAPRSELRGLRTSLTGAYDERSDVQRAQDQELDPGDDVLIEELSRLGTPSDLEKIKAALLEQSLFPTGASRDVLQQPVPPNEETLPPLELGLDALDLLPNESDASAPSPTLASLEVLAHPSGAAQASAVESAASADLRRHVSAPAPFDITASEATGELDRIALSPDDFASIEDSVSASIPPIVQELEDDEDAADSEEGWEDGALFPAQSVLEPSTGLLPSGYAPSGYAPSGYAPSGYASGGFSQAPAGLSADPARTAPASDTTVETAPPPVDELPVLDEGAIAPAGPGAEDEEALDLSPDAIHEMTLGGEGVLIPLAQAPFGSGMAKLEPPPPRPELEEELPLFASQSPSARPRPSVASVSVADDEALFSTMKPLGSSVRPHREGWGAPDKLNPEEQALLDQITQLFQSRADFGRDRGSRPKRRGLRADMRRTGIVVALTNAQKALLRDRAEMYNHIFTVIFTQVARKLGRDKARLTFHEFFEGSNGVHPELFTQLSFKADGMIDSEMLIRNLESYPSHRPIQLFETCLQDIFQFLIRQIDHLLDAAEQASLMDAITPIFNLLNKRPEPGA